MLFLRGSRWAEKQAIRAGILWMMPLAGLLTGVVSAVPQVMGNGRATAQLGFSSKADRDRPILLLSALLAQGDRHLADDRVPARPAACCSRACVGRVRWCDAGHSVDADVPYEFDRHVRCWVRALLAASQQAPLMAIRLVMELADAPIGLFVPIGFAVAVNAFTASRLAAPLAALHLPRQMPRQAVICVPPPTWP